ncbi:TIGR02611 family protein [Nocardioides speluncae]|uniref:TIGR02611 family protein n=1 Tax=Nocardioides speluncae TaxID=2670337 RepID=UPI00197CE5CB|nr:TIGR02611 family protein [Nocardioides speluncae]
MSESPVPESPEDGPELKEPGPLKRLHERMHRNPVTGLITKIVVTIAGVVVLTAGVIMMVTPGPGIVGIALGLGILATEYHWARRLLHYAKRKAEEAAAKARAVDPAVRRRRIILGTLAVLVVVGGVAAYVYAYDWPNYAVDGWDWVQDIAGFVPELPGM